MEEDKEATKKVPVPHKRSYSITQLEHEGTLLITIALVGGADGSPILFEAYLPGSLQSFPELTVHASTRHCWLYEDRIRYQLDT